MNIKLIVIIFSLLSLTAYRADATNIYLWNDANGVMHAVDDLDKVPAQYRSSVKEIDKEGSSLESAVNVILAKAESYKLVLAGL